MLLVVLLSSGWKSGLRSGMIAPRRDQGVTWQTFDHSAAHGA